MTALDLRTAVPRSPFDELEGFAWLPRMIDKARAYFAGTHGAYTPYPCPGDKAFLGHFGLDAAALGEVIEGGADDAAIAAWVVAHAKDATSEKKAAYRRGLTHPSSNPFMWLVVRVFRAMNGAAIRKASPGVALGRLDTLAKIVTAEEGHPIPAA
jgi:hypothetical protein